MAKAGDRVGAISESNEDSVSLYGYGMYLGDVDVPGMWIPVPKIALDGGGFVYGYECWWGPEDKVKASIGERKVIEVPAPAHWKNP